MRHQKKREQNSTIINTLQKHLWLIIFLWGWSGNAQNPWVQDITQMVSGDSIYSTIADLQKMDRVTSSNDQNPPHYLKQRLLEYQVDTVFFQYFKANTPPNVVGIRYGITDPDEYWIMGAHYDAVLPGAGADDNGSGTAAVLEMARVTQGYRLHKSLIMVLFAAEEVGLWGSHAFVDSAVNHITIKGMINLDMIGYSHQQEDSSVSVCWKYFCQDLITDYLASCSLYVPELILEQDTTSSLIYASDHAPFWASMIPALFLIENSDRWGGNFNPYYHQYADTIGKGFNSPWLAEKITRSAVATLMHLTDPLPNIHVPEHQTRKKNLLVFPNPATNLISWKPDETTPKPRHIRIYDFTGRQVIFSSLAPGQNSVDIEALPSGVYLLQLDIHNETQNTTFIKQ